jgi:hypothetical protein
MSASKVIAIEVGPSKRLIVYMEMFEAKGKGRGVDPHEILLVIRNSSSASTSYSSSTKMAFHVLL